MLGFCFIFLLKSLCVSMYKFKHIMYLLVHVRCCLKELHLDSIEAGFKCSNMPSFLFLRKENFVMIVSKL